MNALDVYNIHMRQQITRFEIPTWNIPEGDKTLNARVKTAPMANSEFYICDSKPGLVAFDITDFCFSIGVPLFFAHIKHPSFFFFF